MKQYNETLQLFAAPLQTTGTEGLSAEMKTFYDGCLLDNAEPNLVHEQFGDEYPIPQGRGKVIEFRKFSRLNKAMTPLTEGVTPERQHPECDGQHRYRAAVWRFYPDVRHAGYDGAG